MVNHGEPKNGPSPDGGTPQNGGGPAVILSFFFCGFSTINHPAIGVYRYTHVWKSP